jgi:hypothetical protein
MIKKLQPGTPFLVGLWDELARIYLERLNDEKSARQALDVAHSLDPDSPARNALLAELHVQAGPDNADKAIELHGRVISADPRRYESYHALRKLYEATYQYDKVGCICSALVFAGKADADERRIAEERAETPMLRAGGQQLTEEAWRRVFHPLASRRIGVTLGLIWQAVASMHAEPARVWGLRKKARRNVRADSHPVSRIIAATADAFGMPLPDVYFQEREPGTIALANCIARGRLGPALVVRSGLLGKRSQRDVAFLTGRMLTFLRPEHYARLIVPTNAELGVVLLSAIRLVEPSYPIPFESASAVAHYLPELERRLPVAIRPQLAVAVSTLLDGGDEPDVGTWSRGVNATSYRAGFIACGDLGTAAELIRGECDSAIADSGKEIDQLLAYAVSENYFAIRAHLGLASTA